MIEEVESKKGNSELTDYKFFCFNGNPKFMYISHDHATDATTDFFDMEFKRLNMRMKDPNSNIIPPKPALFESLKEIAKIICRYSVCKSGYVCYKWENLFWGINFFS